MQAVMLLVRTGSQTHQYSGVWLPCWELAW